MKNKHFCGDDLAYINFEFVVTLTTIELMQFSSCLIIITVYKVESELLILCD